MWNAEEIRERYKVFDDSKIRELASNPTGLRKDIIPILKEEIQRRNLGVEIIAFVDNEIDYFKGVARQGLIREIKKSVCSGCSQKAPLKGYRFTTVVSFLLISNTKTVSRIICSNCASTKRIQSMTKTFFLGWWSKKGILATPFALVSDTIKIFKAESENDKVYNEFIDNNTGSLRTALKSNGGINGVLERFNKA